MKTIKILVTGVGRRIELLQAFKQAAKTLNVDLKLYGADMTGTAPGLAFCDYTRKVCAMRDEGYIPQLLKICQDDGIHLVVPTIDTDLLTLSQNVLEFSAVGTKVMISAPDKIAICRDKNKTANFFEKCGLVTPKTVNNYRKYVGGFPCFIKPKDGSSSINAYKVYDAEELKVYSELIDGYIIQPFIDGTEYTVDVFCDFDGHPVYITPRIRLAVRSGEVLKTQISMDTKIITEIKQLVSLFKPCGPITVQLIRQVATGEDYFIEINPRFGGGAPLSMKAGAKSAKAILQLLSGKKLSYQTHIDNNAIYSRFDQSVCISNGDGGQEVKGVIFDLDDTLYSEKDYVKSGYKAVALFLGDEKYADKLWHYFLEGKQAINELLKDINAEEKIQECLYIYREHKPTLSLYNGVITLLKKLKEKGIKIGIITDGRINGQKNKLQALRLYEIVDDVVITDELGGVQFRKPCDIAFRIMQNKWRIPFEQLIYVGDNINKDFQAPKQLGMRYIHFKNKEGLYNSSSTENFSNVIEQLNTIIK